MEEPIQHKDSWDCGEYRTGSVEPRPRHSGVVALLLIAVIVLSGSCIILGAVNVQLFAVLIAQPNVDFSVAQQQEQPEHLEPNLEPVTIQLQGEPGRDAGMNTQQIYLNCAPSVVCIRADGMASAGIVVSEHGYILTGCRLVENAKRVTVHLRDNRSYAATIVGLDWASDLAVLHIEAENLPVAVFGDAEQLKVGDAVCTIDPDADGAVNGFVSSFVSHVTICGGELKLIQSSADMHTGMPLINTHGQIVGIHTEDSALFSGGDNNCSLSIPSTIIKEVTEQLIGQGFVAGRPHLGIRGQTVSQRIQSYYNVPAGLYITYAESNGPAYEAGIRRGDILMGLNGWTIKSREDFAEVLYRCKPGQSVQLQVYRDGEVITISVVIEEGGA